MEVVDEAEAQNDVDDSPALTAAVPMVPISKIPAMSLLHPADGPMPLPEGMATSFANSAAN